jgi:chromosome segregation protein
MKLTRLELSGFKSFADTIELPFEEGMTCIVGPNGCGKSNVSDAVRWVLGEQRARMLRGAKMDEVIFQGSAKRKQLNVAEVSLYFDNSDGTLPVSYQEVVVTRRLSRSGQSDYLLNQTPTRLKDVQDLLRGTGLGSDAGVVIEARMIDRLLSEKADERRSLFEEAAGIGLYRDRKITTERRLEKTGEDLQRLDDLISEVQTQVRSLARQRGKAERHERFVGERFAIVMELARRSLANFERSSEELLERRTDLDRRLPERRETLSSTERKREERVQARATAEARRTVVERQLAEKRLDAGKLEGDLNLASERLQNVTSRKERAQEERQLAEARGSKAQLELDAAAAERNAAQSARESVQVELDLRASSEDQTRDRLTSQRARVRESETRLQQQAEETRSLAGERSALTRELDELNSRQSDANQQHSAASRLFDETSEGLARARAELESRESAHRDGTTRLEAARHALAASREREAATLVERRAAEEAASQLGARREALQALERDRAGLAPGARRLIDGRAQFDEGAVLGPLSDFVKTTQEGAPLVERLLAEWLHAVVVRDEETIHAVRAWHLEYKPGPILLLPLTPGPRSIATHADAFTDIEVEQALRPWVAALLGGTVHLDEEGLAIRRANGAVFLGAAEDAAGPLSRRAELQDVAADLTRATSNVARLEQASSEAAQANELAEEALQGAIGQAEESRQRLQESKGVVDDFVRESQRLERDRAEAAAARTRLEQIIEVRSQRLREVDADLDRLGRLRTELETELEEQRTGLSNFEAEQEAAREQRVHWQVEEAQVSAREQAARERQDRAATALRDAVEEMARLDEELSAIEGSTAELNGQRSQWTDSLAERTAEVQRLEQAAGEAEEQVGQSETALTACERDLEALRNEVHQLGEEIHHVEIEQTELTGRRQALIERVEAEWHKPIAELLNASEAVEGESDTLEEEAARLAAAIEQIGPVNPLAAQEYQEEQQRLEFLTTQREDLIDARNSLRQSLREIDQTARELFDESFAAVREHFKMVFQTLFEGGDCDVLLSDSSDPLTSDIEIRAAPRGKRTQRIHLLSSGERALVAISLLFAIYLAKPSPFCLLDEVDAPLDDANVQRFIRLLTQFKADTQFIVITHNPRTMQVADAVYGVTMQEPGVSTIVGVRLGERIHA